MFSEHFKKTLYNDVKDYLNSEKRHCENCIIEEIDVEWDDNLCYYCKDHKHFSKHDQILLQIRILDFLYEISLELYHKYKSFFNSSFTS